MKQHYDIAIIGAGPAGMASAIEISRNNIKVIVFDEQKEPGGQIYRTSKTSILSNPDVFDQDYLYGHSLIEKFRKSDAEYFPSSTIWQISKDLEIGVSRGGSSHLISTDHIILATGAIERPFPIPGWTLPGVATIGSAQILLKTAGLVEDNAVLIGTGPLMYLLAVQYLRAGVTIKAILDTNPQINKWKALKYLPAALKNLDLLIKGNKWLTEIKKSQTPFYENISDIELHGDQKLSYVSFRSKNGKILQINTKKTYLHQGVTPNINLAMAAGCQHEWDPIQLCWKPITTEDGKTNVPGLWIAGDGAGIIGAKASEAAGHVTANAILNQLGKNTLKTYDHVWGKQLKKEKAFRPFIDLLFQPAKGFRIPINDGTIVCRCEEITAGEIKKNIALGCIGPNQLKAFCRSGMGPCQGRFCGLTVSEIIANERGLPVAEVGYYRIRPPVKPLTLDELATLNNTPLTLE